MTNDEMAKFDDLICEIIDWFKSTFPDVTFDQQADKTVEEINEVGKETTLEGKQREAVDVFIAYVGLATKCPNMIVLPMTIACMFNLTPKMIREKLEINKARTWIKDKNGIYRHADN